MNKEQITKIVEETIEASYFNPARLRSVDAMEVDRLTLNLISNLEKVAVAEEKLMVQLAKNTEGLTEQLFAKEKELLVAQEASERETAVRKQLEAKVKRFEAKSIKTKFNLNEQVYFKLRKSIVKGTVTGFSIDANEKVSYLIRYSPDLELSNISVAEDDIYSKDQAYKLINLL